MKNYIFVLLMLLLIPGQFHGLYLLCEETDSSSDVEYVTTIGNEASMNWTKQVMSVKGNGFGRDPLSLARNRGRRKWGYLHKRPTGRHQVDEEHCELYLDISELVPNGEEYGEEFFGSGGPIVPCPRDPRVLSHVEGLGQYRRE
ncbi:MAG: hypothetical protein MUF15_25470, partial [Acidobacteria bacterium]|nr:hypothetical protein [Acidobacteriota bacterium]